MIGVFVLVPRLISFAVSILLGLTLTLTGFAVSRKKQLKSESGKIWMIAVASALIIAALILSLTVHVSSGGQPTEERYQQMALAIALLLSVPGAALSAGGITLFILSGRAIKISDRE